MKAFLSDIETRNRIAQHFGPDIYGHATNEAKRILAETESLETFTYGHHRFEGSYVKTELSRSHDGIGHAELAESLAAFLESPDPEGYLISDQPMAG